MCNYDSINWTKVTLQKRPCPHFSRIYAFIRYWRYCYLFFNFGDAWQPSRYFNPVGLWKWIRLIILNKGYSQ